MGCSPWGCKESDTTEQLSTQHIQWLNLNFPIEISSLTHAHTRSAGSPLWGGSPCPLQGRAPSTIEAESAGFHFPSLSLLEHEHVNEALPTTSTCARLWSHSYAHGETVSTRGPFQGHTVAAVATAGQDANVSNSSSAEAAFGSGSWWDQPWGLQCLPGRENVSSQHPFLNMI